MPIKARPACPYYGFTLSEDYQSLYESRADNCALDRPEPCTCVYRFDDHGPDWERCFKLKSPFAILLNDLLRLVTVVYPAENPEGVPLNVFATRLKVESVKLSRGAGA